MTAERCSCGQSLPKRAKRFCSRACYRAFMATPGRNPSLGFTPQARVAAHVSRRKKAETFATRFVSKAAAYRSGYRVGYNRAYRYFRSRRALSR
jgi:hypothetical protein